MKCELSQLQIQEHLDERSYRVKDGIGTMESLSHLEAIVTKEQQKVQKKQRQLVLGKNQGELGGSTERCRDERRNSN